MIDGTLGWGRGLLMAALALTAGCYSEHHYGDDDCELGTIDERWSEDGPWGRRAGRRCRTDDEAPIEGPCDDRSGASFLSRDRALCDAVEWDCPSGEVGFAASCGCGCVDEAIGSGGGGAGAGSGSGGGAIDAGSGSGGGAIDSGSGSGGGAIDAGSGSGGGAPDAGGGPADAGSGGGSGSGPGDTAPAACPADPSAPGVSLLSTDEALCAAIRFECPAGLTAFSGSCGCGCVDPASSGGAGGGAPVCPDAAAPEVVYLTEDVEACDKIDYRCPAGCIAFSSACGCGCIELQ